MDEFLFNKTAVPDDTRLSEFMGNAWEAYQDMLKQVQEMWPGMELVWKFAGAKYGWAMRLVLKKRIVCYLRAEPDMLRVSFLLGRKAINSCRATELPVWLDELLKNAKHYPEGEHIALVITGAEEIEQILSLIEIKLSY